MAGGHERYRANKLDATAQRGERMLTVRSQLSSIHFAFYPRVSRLDTLKWLTLAAY